MDPALEKRLKRQIIGKTHRFLAVTPLGFEQTLVSEFKAIGIETASEPTSSADGFRIVGDGKVEFTAKITEAWNAVAYSRIANRVLMHIADFKAENFRELEKKASEIPWELYLTTIHQPLTTIHVTCKHSRLYHSDAIAERLYKIIEGVSVPLASADTASATPSAGTPRNAPSQNENRGTPQNLYVNFLDDRCTIWQDLAGEELYKRGFERFVNDAPLKETIASAMIFEALHVNSQLPNLQDVTPDSVLFDHLELQLLRGHDPRMGTRPPYTILDPMSGSGTFSLEAACIANKIIPGTCRDFALKHQPAFKEATWNFIIKSASNDVATITKIITSDISERAVSIIKHNVECSPLAHIEPAPIAPQQKDFFSYTAKEIADACSDTSPILVLNPPYGKRLDFDAPKLYTQIGQKLTELARDLRHLGKTLTVAILAPKDDTRDGARYTCTANLLHECPALSPEHATTAKVIQTSHGGFSLNAFFATI